MLRRPFIAVIGASFILSGAALADPIADRAAARRLVAAQDWPAAARAYEALTAADPRRGADWYYLGMALARAGDCARASPALERALAFGATGSVGGLRNARIESAACAVARGDVAEALVHLSEAQGPLGLDLSTLAGDSRFAALRSDPGFVTLNGGPPPTDRTAGWRSDLAWFVNLVRRRHPDPFHTVTEAEWTAQVDILHAAMPRLSDLEATAGFMRLAAMIGDGHTTVLPPVQGPHAFHMLPITPYAFEDGWRVLSAAPDHAALVGRKIVAINGQPIDAVLERTSGALPRDNDMSLRWIQSVALQFSEFAAIGDPQAEADAAVLTLEDEAGRRTETRLAGGPVDRDPTTAWPPADRATLGAATRPLWLRNADRAFWMERLPSGDLYVQINQIRDDGDRRFTAFAAEVGRELAKAGTVRLILDLRHNNGGSGSLNWSLVREIVRADGLDSETGLFVLIGRRTFSAAMNLTSMLETHASPIFVGEPTGSRPNFYGEDTPFTLPYSGLTGSISSAWFQGGTTSFDQRPWIAPDLPAPLAVEHLKQGRDPALEAVAAHLASR